MLVVLVLIPAKVRQLLPSGYQTGKQLLLRLIHYIPGVPLTLGEAEQLQSLSLIPLTGLLPGHLRQLQYPKVAVVLEIRSLQMEYLQMSHIKKQQ